MTLTPTVLIGLLIMVGLILYLRPFAKTKYTNVKIGGFEIGAEIADTPAKKIKGLMFRRSLKENEGMLLPYDEEGYYGIWMMNMSIPIDIIWLDAGKKVVHIEKNAPPCLLNCPVYSPEKPGMYILEVSSNFTERHNIEIGSRADFSV